MFTGLDYKKSLDRRATSRKTASARDNATSSTVPSDPKAGVRLLEKHQAPIKTNCSNGTHMPEVNSVLGKRLASHTDQTSRSIDRTHMAHGKPAKRGTPKCGKLRRDNREPAEVLDEEGHPMEGLEDMEATSFGAAG